MTDQGKYLTRRQVKEEYGLSLNFIDKRLPRTKVGGKVLHSKAAIDALLTGVPDYRGLAWQSMRVWEVNTYRALSDQKADMLTSTVCGFLIEHPGGDIRTDAFILYAQANSPAGGGETGRSLRADIEMEARLRSLIRAA